jgi:hypothetical protein
LNTTTQTKEYLCKKRPKPFSPQQSFSFWRVKNISGGQKGAKRSTYWFKPPVWEGGT